MYILGERCMLGTDTGYRIYKKMLLFASFCVYLDTGVKNAHLKAETTDGLLRMAAVLGSERDLSVKMIS